MSVPTAITDLSTTASSNPPAGSEAPTDGDNHFRAGYSFIAQLNSEKAPKASPTFTGTVTADVLTTTGNATLGNASTDTLNVGNGGIVKDASGNVGIGSASPTGKLQVGDASAATSAVVRGSASGTGGGGAVIVQNSTNTVIGIGNSSLLVGGAYSSQPMLYTAGGLVINDSSTEIMRIDASGNVISNVTSSAPSLGINRQMVFNLTSNTNLQISVRGSDGTTRTANITLA